MAKPPNKQPNAAKFKVVPSVAAEINRLHNEVIGELKVTLPKAIQIGKLLEEEKVRHKHGEWQKWLGANIKFDLSTARRYMRCFENSKTGTVPVLNIVATARLKDKSPTAKKPTTKHIASVEELEEELVKTGVCPVCESAKESNLPVEGDQVVIDLPVKVTTGTILEAIKKLQSLFGRYWEKDEHGFSAARKPEIQDLLSDLLNEVKAKEEQK